MDAYDGTMNFYVADPDGPADPRLAGRVPELFEPAVEDAGRAPGHLRVPEELFNVQTRMYGQYHVTQPLTLFNNTDRWTVPDAQTNEQTLPPEAYYVVMRMPGEPKAEFLLLQPMIPTQPAEHDRVGRRPQRRRRLRRRCAPSGSRRTRRSSGRPRSRRGSTRTRRSARRSRSGTRAGREVIRGNLIVVPVGDSLLYLQPVYLQSTSSAFPEFQKIVVASPTTVVWGDTLREALKPLLAAQGGGPAPRRRPVRRPTPGSDAPRPAPRRRRSRRRRRATGCRPTSTGWSSTRTPTSSSPRRRCGTATSRPTARRSRRSRRRSSASAS